MPRRHPLLQNCTSLVAFLLALALLGDPNACWAQSAVPVAAERPGTLSAAERTDLYRQLRGQAEYFEKQSAVVKTAAKLMGPTLVHVEADVTRRPALSVGPGRQVEENGSGVIIQYANKHYVLTSRHVIAGAELTAIKINLADGRRIFPTKVLEDKDTDVAVLAVSTDDLTAAPLADSDRVEIGDFVIALGNPFGLTHSVTFGIISAKGRRNLELGEAGIRFQDFLQTDAAINPGNSGGPLVNLRGEVIGINTCIASSSGGNEGIGFAIPINMFMGVARQLIDNGKVSRSFLGVRLDRDFGPAMAVEAGLPRLFGARVLEVFEKSAAAEANLQAGDVILKLDDVHIENDAHLVNLVSLTPAGKRVALSVLRNRQVISVAATLKAATD